MDALLANTSGSRNIALGYSAGYHLTTGSDNICIGNQGVAGDDNTIRIGDVQTQTFIAGVITGNGAGLTSLNAASLTGSAGNFSAANISFSGSITGDGAGLTNLSVGNFNGSQGADLTLTGNLRLPATTASGGIIYLDGQTMLHAYGSVNTFLGQNAGNLTMVSQFPYSGCENTAVGAGAFSHNTSGAWNSANGAAALFYNTGGSVNTADGYGALMYNTNGSYNAADGAEALYNNISGSYNTASGYQALYANQNGQDNTANGVYALYNNTNGYDNTAVGYNALSGNTSGHFNTALAQVRQLIE
jgi:hypothetical protein